MEYIKSTDTNIYNIINDIINSSLIKKKIIINTNFFSHNTKYKNGINLIKYGILSANEKERRNVFKNVKQGISNVNGRDFISVSKDENIPERGFQMTYDAYNERYLNFIISEEKIRKSTRVMRNNTNYVNEYLIENYIPTDTFICIQTRLLKLIKLLENNSSLHTKQELIDNYNELIDIIKYIQNSNLKIIESSNENIEINKKEFIYLAKKII